MIVNSLAGLPAFAAYFIAMSMLCVAFVYAYTAITPNRELELIRDGNASAALAVGMSLIGFSIPLASAVFHSVNLVDCAIWGVIALIVQLIAYRVARAVKPEMPEHIAKGDLSGGIWVGCISITAGILNAACMSY